MGFKITEKAKKELKRILEATVEMPQARLRLCERGHGELGIGVDIEESDDLVFNYGEERILVVKKHLEEKLENITLDVDETALGPQLVICGDFG